MKTRKGSIFLVILLACGDAVPRVAAEQGGEDERSPKGDVGGKRGSFGLLRRAFQEVKRVGAAIDPNAMAEVEKAWSDLTPEIRKAAGELAQAKDQIAGLKKEVGDAWSAARRTGRGSETRVGEGDLEGGGEGGLEEGGMAMFDVGQLAKDAAVAAKGIVGDVLGDVTSEIASSLEDTLDFALSEGNLREASKAWRNLLETPGVMLIARDRSMWAGAEKAMQRHLQSYMSKKSMMKAEKLMNATANYALHFAGLGRNAAKSDYEIFQELSSKMCHLQGAAEKLWPMTSRALPFLGYNDYISSMEKALRAHVVSRLTLTVTAGALLGLNPRNDPFLMTLIAAFSLGHLTKDVAVNLAIFFQKAVVETSPSFHQRPAGSDQPISALDLIGELVSGTATCQEMGHRAFQFFEVMKRAVSSVPESAASKAHTVLLTSDVLATRVVARPAGELRMDGRMLGLTLWIASTVDRFPYDPRLLLLVFCSVLFCLVWGWWKLYRWSYGRRQVRRSAKIKVL